MELVVGKISYCCFFLKSFWAMASFISVSWSTKYGLNYHWSWVGKRNNLIERNNLTDGWRRSSGIVFFAGVLPPHPSPGRSTTLLFHKFLKFKTKKQTMEGYWVSYSAPPRQLSFFLWMQKSNSNVMIQRDIRNFLQVPDI